MKRLFVVISLLFSCFIYLGAQVKVSSGSSCIDVAVKRAFAQGDDVYVDLIITGLSNWNMVYFHGRRGDSCKFFDDEGNVYQSQDLYGNGKVNFEVDGEQWYSECRLIIEKNVPRKIRFIVKNVDEYATSFPKISLRYYGNGTSANDCCITIQNLPITR